VKTEQKKVGKGTKIRENRTKSKVNYNNKPNSAKDFLTNFQ
jgi:stalled ribosome alternative rescue factor ArfA